MQTVGMELGLVLMCCAPVVFASLKLLWRTAIHVRTQQAAVAAAKASRHG